jgi:hypothetical protein
MEVLVESRTEDGCLARVPSLRLPTAKRNLRPFSSEGNRRKSSARENAEYKDHKKSPG